MGPGVPTAVIGTLGLTTGEGARPATAGLTTPGPVQISVWLRELADGGMSAVVIEASSHALAQHRLDAVRFDVVIFTNLSRAHLDYHAGLGEYLAAKARLVALASGDATVVVNAAEPAWEALDPGGRAVRTFAVDSPADVRASDVECAADGSRFLLTVGSEERAVRLPLVGRFNVENALAAVTAALAAGIALDDVVERLATAPQVKGRMEAVATSPFTVLIDFAHTPAGLESALSALRPLTRGRLIVVFGAGGDRDREKRRPMAEAAGRIADLVVITSDNPRNEDPEAILDALEGGLRDGHFLRIADRRQAIEAALRSARPGDTVVLAGKGHETEQVIGATRHPFDERAVVLDCLRRLEVL